VRCRRSIIKNKKATVGVAITIIVFILAISATAAIIFSVYSFIQDTNKSMQLAIARANEKLVIHLVTYDRTIDPHAIIIENIGKGPEVSEIVALLKRNSKTLKTENFTLSETIKIHLAETIRVDTSKYFTINEEDQVGVLTKLGNVFWGFAVKVTFMVVKTISPSLPQNITIDPNAVMLTVDGKSYTAEQLESPGLSFLWSAGTQHQFSWVPLIEAVGQTGNDTIYWVYNGTTGAVYLPSTENSAVFQAPYVNHNIVGHYFAQSSESFSLNVSEEGEKEEKIPRLTEAKVNLSAGSGGLTIFLPLYLILTFFNRKWSKAGLSPIITAIILLLIIIPATFILLVVVPRLNWAISAASELEQIMADKAKEKIDAFVYQFDAEAQTVVIHVVNTGPIPVTITHALIIDYSGSPPVKMVSFNNGSIAVGEEHFFIIGPKTADAWGLPEGPSVSQNFTAVSAFERISLITDKGNAFVVSG